MGSEEAAKHASVHASAFNIVGGALTLCSWCTSVPELLAAGPGRISKSTIFCVGRIGGADTKYRLRYSMGDSFRGMIRSRHIVLPGLH
jgi:hypothetical protein